MRISLMPLANCLLIVCFFWSSGVSAGPKGTLTARQVPDGTITIDGGFTDWGLDTFTQPTEQPLFPDARDTDSNDAMGDHILFDLDRVGLFNNTPDCSAGPCGFTNESPIDFGSAMYFVWDSKAVYVLSIFIDDELRGDRDTTLNGSSNFLNDGYEVFFDAAGNSTDIADELGNPPNINFDDDQVGATPNLDDFQITVALNENFPSPDGPGSIGARQHMERSGQPGLLGGFGEDDPWEFFEDVVADERNGEGGIYRDALTAFGTDVAARSYENLREAGAKNPEITANPDTVFPGFAIEAAIPFGFIPEFVPDHNMGFNLFWRDTDEDNEPDVGGGNINWADWAQNTTVRGEEGPNGEAIGLNHTGTWGEIQFAGDFEPIVALQPGDADQDLDFDQVDIVQVLVADKYLNGQTATWGEGDWDGGPGGGQGDPPPGDGLFNQRDIIAALGAAVFLTGPYGTVQPGGAENDAQTSVVYDAGTGELAIDAPTGVDLTSINIDSAASIFTGEPAQNLGGSFDNDADNNIFKATFGSSFGSLSFGNVAQAGLSEAFILNDLTVVGSLAGGGSLGDVDLIYIPEPSTLLLALLGYVGMLHWRRRSTKQRGIERPPADTRPTGSSNSAA